MVFIIEEVREIGSDFLKRTAQVLRFYLVLI